MGFGFGRWIGIKTKLKSQRIFIKMSIKGYIGRLKKQGKGNLEVLEILFKMKPFTMWEGINLADYLNNKYP